MSLLVGTILVITASILVAAYFALRHGRKSERELSALALVVTVLTFVFATIQNAQSMHDAARSADASERSAAAALSALRIDMTPAAVIDCSMGANGKNDEEVPLTPNSKYVLAVPGPTPAQPSTSYFTCVIRNYGHEPLLGIAVPLQYQYYRVIAPGKSVVLGTKTRYVYIDGIAPQQSYTIWIDNRSVHLSANVWAPQTMIFVEPSNPHQPLSYVFPRIGKYTIAILIPVHVKNPNSAFFKTMP